MGNSRNRLTHQYAIALVNYRGGNKMEDGFRCLLLAMGNSIITTGLIFLISGFFQQFLV